MSFGPAFRKYSRLAATAAVATVSLVCHDATAPKKIGLVSLQEDSAVVATPTTLHATVVDASGFPIANVRVQWTVSGGATDSAATTTNSSGVASVVWTPPTIAGPNTVTIEIADHTQQAKLVRTVYTRAGPAARIVIAPDSVVFTRLATRDVLLEAYDVYDNRLYNYSLASTASSAAVGSSLTNDALHIAPALPLAAVDTASVKILAANNAVLGVVKVRVNPVVALIVLVSGVDSVAGLTVGESQPFAVAFKDSGSVTFVPRTFSVTSDAPSIASVVGSAISGVGIGSTTIHANSGAVTLNHAVAVVPTIDLGVRQFLYAMPVGPIPYVAAPTLVTPSGRSMSGYVKMPTSQGPTMYAAYNWYDASGTNLATHVFDVSSPVVLLSVRPTTGTSYLSRPLAKLDSVGAVVWQRAETGFSVSADDSLVVLAAGADVQAYGVDGTPLWWYTGVNPILVDVGPKQVYSRNTTTLRAFNRGGTQIWTTPIASTAIGTRLVVDTNTVFVADGSLRAFDLTGNVLWTVANASQPDIVLAPGNVVLIGNGTSLSARDRTTGAVAWTRTTSGVTGPIALVGNTVYRTGAYTYAYSLSTGAPLGRTTDRANATRIAPVCTPSGLVVATADTLWRYAKCQ